MSDNPDTIILVTELHQMVQDQAIQIENQALQIRIMTAALVEFQSDLKTFKRGNAALKGYE